MPNDDIVIFVSSVRRIAELGLQFVFTNQHAYPLIAEYFTDFAQLDRIDWPLLRSRNFTHDPDDPGKKERYQAEALIWKQVPLDALLGICCYRQAVELQIKAQLDERGLTLRTDVQQTWYF